MLQKRLTIIMTVILLITSLPFTALGESWICPACGKENTSNFCGNCGARRPEPTDAPAVQVTAPPEAPLPMTRATEVPVSPTATPSLGGSLFSWLFQQTEAPAATVEPTRIPATPVPATMPPVTATPAPTYEWLSDFSIMSGIGYVEVDFSSYAADHPGSYYVYYFYDVNDYYTWFTMDPGETSLRFNVIPGASLLVGVCRDISGAGRPSLTESAMKSVNLMSTFPYTGNGFREAENGAFIMTDSEVTEVKAFALSDYDDTSLGLYASFRWYFDVSGEQEVDVFGVLRAPNGTLYKENSSYVWSPDRSGGNFRYDLRDLLNDCASQKALTTGQYTFELYIDGLLADKVPFAFAQTRTAAATATPRPTKTPTPKPTKTPTPKPTKTPTPKPRTFKINTPKMSKGEVTISWEDSENKGPYLVSVQRQYKSGGSTKLAASQTFDYTSSKSSSNGYIMVPGDPYTITVTDRSGKTATLEYKPTKKKYSAFSVNVTIDLKTKTSKGTKNQSSLSAADIKKNLDNYTYGAYIRLGYPQIKTERTTKWTIAFIIPNGDAYVSQYRTDTIPAGKHYSYYPHYSFDNLFQYLIKTYGSIPTGKYTMQLYFDGQLAGSGTFSVKS